MRLLISLILLFGPLLANAALPPYAESTRRINAVLKDKAVHAALGVSAWVTSVAMREERLYEVISSRGCSVEAQVTCKPPRVQGPCELEIRVIRTSCEPLRE